MGQLIRVRRLSAALLAFFTLFAVALLAPGVALANHQFSDVPTSAFYHDFVDFMVRNGLTSGCGSGLFCPGSAVTRGQLAVFFEKLALLGGCSPDMVKAGPTCIDKYEASVWYVPTALSSLMQQIKLGTATAEDLLADWEPAPIQLGLQSGDLASFGCPVSGNDAGCKDIYAVSIPGVQPARYLSWFQAAAAARNVGKRLPTNAEWQAAALGTPQGSCNTSSGNVAPTGSTAGCVSHVGAFDMVGNLAEWVADWMPRSTTCGTWGSLTDNTQCLAGAATSGPPGALIRGGGSEGSGGSSGTAGVFAVDGRNSPGIPLFVGFRAAR